MKKGYGNEADDSERDQLLFNLISETYISEEKRLNIVDEKASKLVIFVGILIGLQSSFGSLLLKSIPKDNGFYNWYMAFFILIIVFLLASIICGLYAYQFESWKVAPKTSRMIEYGKENISKDDILRMVSKERSDAVEENENKLESKIKRIKCGFAFLLLGIISTLIFIILVLYTT